MRQIKNVCCIGQYQSNYKRWMLPKEEDWSWNNGNTDAKKVLIPTMRQDGKYTYTT